MIYSTKVKENQMADTKIKILWMMKEKVIYPVYAVVLQRMSDTEKQRETEPENTQPSSVHHKKYNEIK